MATKEKEINPEFVILDREGNKNPEYWVSYYCETTEEVEEKLEFLIDDIAKGKDKDPITTFFKDITVYYIGDSKLSIDIKQTRKFKVEL
jgi:hypothetical protein